MSILIALLVDRWCGEPPARLHPVVWMGTYLKWAGRRLTGYGSWAAFVLGALFWLLGAVSVAGIFGYLAIEIATLPAWLALILTGLLLKPLLALRMLLREVCAVENALARGLDQGRARLSVIVSRDTAHLDSNEIRESALESLSENLSDSVIAPLFWFALFGLPGAAVYRFANTADAMWGYRGRWEWAGKFAARADDFLNLIPARLTALVLVLLGPNRRQVLHRLPREAAITQSPNSGWPMSALALSLNVRLRKPQVYALNAGAAAPTPADLRKALHRCEWAGWIAAAGLMLLGMMSSAYLPRLLHA